MATAKITKTERNEKIAIWVTPPEGEQIDNRPWNIWDVSKNPTMDEVLQVAAHAYELGRKHLNLEMSQHLHRDFITMEIDKT
jgi:hypothetical protein